MNDTFSFFRFKHLLRLTLFQEKQRAWLTLLVSVGIALFFILLTYIFDPLLTNQKVFNGHVAYFLVSLLLGGYIFSGAAFIPFRHRPTTYRYLMLGASALEKYLAQWLVNFLLFPVSYLLVYWLFSMLFNALAPVAYAAFYLPFYLPPWGWIVLLIFSCLQLLWLLGAASFAKLPLIKTLLFGGLLMLLLIFGLVFFYKIEIFITFIPRAAYIALYLLPPLGILSGLLTYWTLQEKEA